MLITNNVDFHAYLTNRGVPCTYMVYPPSYYVTDDIIIIFTNDFHAMSVCGNAHQNKYKKEYELECKKLLNWLECGEHVIMISNVIKFGTPYMAKNYPLLQQRYDKLRIVKQVIHTSKIGSLLLPHYVQLRYKGVKPIEFDIVDCGNIRDHKYVWLDKGNVFKHKSQQLHYMNVINASHDTITRRKLRYLPEYSLFSQLYKKLYV